MTALAASSRAICSEVRFQPKAARLSRSCSSLRAPRMIGRDSRPLQEPVECDLRNGLAGLGGYFVERIHNGIEIFVGDLRAGARRSCAGG